MNNNTVYKMAVGDFNANVIRGSLFGVQSSQFSQYNCYTLSDLVCMTDTSFMFHSDAHDTVSRLDHVVSSFSMHELISQMGVLYNYLTFDHFHMSMCVTIGVEEKHQNGSVDGDKHIKFHKTQRDHLSKDILSQCRQTTDSLLGEMELPVDIVNCSGGNCDNHIHINHLSGMYMRIMHCLSDADEACIPEWQKFPVSPVPGWNDYLIQPYKESREAYFLWSNYNKPHWGVVYEHMKRPEQGSNMPRIKYWRNKKKLYVQMHWYQNLQVVMSNASEKKSRKVTLANVAFSNKTENETESQNITNIWRDHYKQLFNSMNDTNDKPYVLSYIRNNHDTTDAMVTVDDMICSITELPNNKSPGYMAWCESILRVLHIVFVSWWQLSYRLWSNMGFSLNNLWQLCLFPSWKARTVTLRANQIVMSM